MLDQDFGADADQDQSADQVQFEVYLAAEVAVSYTHLTLPTN